MATTVSLDTIRKAVTSLLQASQTAFGSGTTGAAPDGSNRQYSSNDEIVSRILEVDAEVCTLIANTMQHPYQAAFIISPPATIAGPAGANPTSNGIVLRIQCQGAPATATFLNSAADVTEDTITITNHGFLTGAGVVYTCSPNVIGGLTSGTTYYVIRVSANLIKLATTQWNAVGGIAINLTSQGTAGNTSTLTAEYLDGTQADSKDTIVQATQYPQIFTSNSAGAGRFWFVEGDYIYTTAPNIKVTYTDFVKTSSPQAPEPYEFAIIAGTVAKILKDGGDSGLAAYYLQMYGAYLQQIASGATVLSAIEAYKG